MRPTKGNKKRYIYKAYYLLIIAITLLSLSISISSALESNCECSGDLVISLSLYFNLMWLLILRPLIILQTLMMTKDSDLNAPSYLDFGTYLVLIFSALFAPFSNSGGLRDKGSDDDGSTQVYEQRFRKYNNEFSVDNSGYISSITSNGSDSNSGNGNSGHYNSTSGSSSRGHYRDAAADNSSRSTQIIYDF